MVPSRCVALVASDHLVVRGRCGALVASVALAAPKLVLVLGAQKQVAVAMVVLVQVVVDRTSNRDRT